MCKCKQLKCKFKSKLKFVLLQILVEYGVRIGLHSNDCIIPSRSSASLRSDCYAHFKQTSY